MRLAPYAIAYLCAGIVMAGLDAVWLTVSNQSLYRAELGSLLASGFRLAPAIAFYLLYLLGVTILAIAPMRAGGARGATLRGALLGLVAYGTYDLTNQATLKTWSLKVTALDLAWGTALTATASVAGWYASRRFTSRRD